MRVVVDDLAFLQCDAIVRPVTARLDSTTPAVRRLERVGGPEFVNRLRLQKDLAVGAAVVTGAGGDLAAEFVIHAVIQSDTEPVTRETVARAWLSALEQAREWEFARITTPPFGIGAGNLATEDAATIMVTVLKSQELHTTLPSDICIVVETAEEREAFEATARAMGVTGA